MDLSFYEYKSVHSSYLIKVCFAGFITEQWPVWDPDQTPKMGVGLHKLQIWLPKVTSTNMVNGWMRQAV